eukprot:6193378-Pleurochrysis_carterae.AAC.2
MSQRHTADRFSSKRSAIIDERGPERASVYARSDRAIASGDYEFTESDNRPSRFCDFRGIAAILE